MSSDILNAIPSQSPLRRRKMTQTKFLITGATGDTGGYTVRQLLEKNHAVRVLAHRPDQRSEQLQKFGAEVVLGDLLDFDSVRDRAERSAARLLLLSDQPGPGAGDRSVRAGCQGSRCRSHRQHVADIRARRREKRRRPSALARRARIRLVGGTGGTGGPPQADVLRRMAALPRANDPPG